MWHWKYILVPFSRRMKTGFYRVLSKAHSVKVVRFKVTVGTLIMSHLLTPFFFLFSRIFGYFEHILLHVHLGLDLMHSFSSILKYFRLSNSLKGKEKFISDSVVGSLYETLLE